MTNGERLLHHHIETLVADPARWQTLLADDVVWELPFAPALGHPARVSGRAEVQQFAAWFVGAVENFRFFDVRVQACADPEAAVAEVRGEGRIKATGRRYRQVPSSSRDLTTHPQYVNRTASVKVFLPTDGIAISRLMSPYSIPRDFNSSRRVSGIQAPFFPPTVAKS